MVAKGSRGKERLLIEKAIVSGAVALWGPHPWFTEEAFQRVVKWAAKLNPPGALVSKIPTHMYVAEKRALSFVARTLPANAQCLEIGSYLGASAACLASALAEGRGGHVFCVDTWMNDAMGPGEPPGDVFDTFVENTQPWSKRISALRGRSDKVAEDYSGGPIDLLFIDGDHSLEGVSTDWRVWSPFLTDRAWACFHDFTRADGVRWVVEKALPTTHDVEFFARIDSMAVLKVTRRKRTDEAGQDRPE
jgi:Methyltransferase domain